MLTRLIKSFFGRFGYTIARTRDEPATYDVLVRGLVDRRQMSTLVVVGANDGKKNDPLYRLAIELRDRSHVVLVEPQPSLINLLTANYAAHPHAHVYEGAVGAGGMLTLFAVKKEYWSRFNYKSARKTRLEHGLTGLTSSSREHVTSWLTRHTVFDCNLDDAIEQIVVRSETLPQIISNLNLPPTIDLLQVDAEGFDDEVLYNCGLSELAPPVIRYEKVNLTAERQKCLEQYLVGLGYICIAQGNDNIAIRVCGETAISPG